MPGADAAERPMTARWTEDGGELRADGTLASRDGRTRALLEVRFRRWTGRHGGWGYSALDGPVRVAIDLASGGHTVTACGPLQLVGGGALRGTPVADVSFTEATGGTERRLEGQVGPHDAARLVGR